MDEAAFERKVAEARSSRRRSTASTSATTWKASRKSRRATRSSTTPARILRRRHVSTKLEKRVWRQRHPLWGVQRFELLRCFAQRRLEVPNTEAHQTALHPVDNARALTDQPFALTVRALGILLRQRRNRCHVAVIWFTTQPADEDAFEQSSVESICFRPAMLARYCHARRMDDVDFDVASL
jgi:hypothetical protein